MYGDLPIIMVRYLAQYFGQMDNFDAFSRQMSALVDLGTVALLYFIVKKLYKPGVALLAATFSALAVMQIQESHYYTTDNFATFFMFLATYFAVAISVSRDGSPSEGKPNFFKRFFKDRVLWLSVAFGITFGMAVGSKLNAFPLAVLLPIALGIRYFRNRQTRTVDTVDSAAIKRPVVEDFLLQNLAFMVVGGFFAILSFRVFQPYAFVGLSLNPKWLANIQEVRRQATPDANLAWALQWARRTHLYSFQNLTVWGLGLPLGILAWSGFLWMAWRMVKGEWLQHFLLWSWTAGYFIWQSLQYNPTMRYQLPIYPLLAMMAAWFVFWLWDKGKQAVGQGRWSALFRPAAVVLGAGVLVLTIGWAYAFLNIYIHPEPRIAASKWIFQNIPGPINLEIKICRWEKRLSAAPAVPGRQCYPGKCPLPDGFCYASRWFIGPGLCTLCCRAGPCYLGEFADNDLAEPGGSTATGNRHVDHIHTHCRGRYQPIRVFRSTATAGGPNNLHT